MAVTGIGRGGSAGGAGPVRIEVLGSKGASDQRPAIL